DKIAQNYCTNMTRPHDVEHHQQLLRGQTDTSFKLAFFFTTVPGSGPTWRSTGSWRPRWKGARCP
ncbi:hypothetical protein, partial [Mycobacterium tuberculosis]|uniref:hypothetical protein n=1 Tax=Mycobacterium tuberculosis TaxID=1773 RepID=UPI001AE071C7